MIRLELWLRANEMAWPDALAVPSILRGHNDPLEMREVDRFEVQAAHQSLADAYLARPCFARLLSGP